MSDDLFEFLAAQEGERAAPPSKSAPKPVRPQTAPPTETDESGPMSDDLFEFLAAQEAAPAVAPATPVRKSMAQIWAVVEQIKADSGFVRTTRG